MEIDYIVFSLVSISLYLVLDKVVGGPNKEGGCVVVVGKVILLVLWVLASIAIIGMRASV